MYVLLFKYGKKTNKKKTLTIWIFCLTRQDDLLKTYVMINHRGAALDCDP